MHLKVISVILKLAAIVIYLNRYCVFSLQSFGAVVQDSIDFSQGKTIARSSLMVEDSVKPRGLPEFPLLFLLIDPSNVD